MDSHELELRLRLKVEGTEALNTVNNSAKALGSTVNQESASVNKFERALQGLERQAKLAAAQSSQAQEALRRQFSVEDASKYAKTEEQVRRLATAHAQLWQAQQKTADFASKVGDAIRNPFQAAGNAAESFLNKLGPVGGVILGVGAAAALGTSKLIQWADAFAQTAREVTNFSLRTGLSIEGAQSFIRVSQLAGVNAFTLESGMRKLSEAMSDNGLETKRTSEAMQRLGVNAYTTQGQLRPMDQLLPELFGNLKNISNQADRNTVAFLLFGRSFKELLPVINQFDSLSKQVKESGVIFSDEAISQADEYRKNIVQVRMELEALRNAVALPFIVYINRVLSTAPTPEGQVRQAGIGAAGVALANSEDFFSTGDAQRRRPLNQSIGGILSPGDLHPKVRNPAEPDFDKDARQARDQAAAAARVIANDRLERIIEGGDDEDARLRKQHTASLEKAKEAFGRLQGRPNVDPNSPAEAEDRATVEREGKRANAIEAQIKLNKELRDEEKKLEQQRRATALEGLTGADKFRKELEFQLQDIDKISKGPSVNKFRREARDTERQKEQDFNTKQAAEIAETARQKNLNAVVAGIRSDAKVALRRAQLESGEDENTPGAVQSGFQRRVRDANQIFNAQIQSAQQITNEKKKQEALDAAGAEHQKEVDAAKQAASLQLLQIEKQERKASEGADSSIIDVSLAQQKNRVQAGFAGRFQRLGGNVSLGASDQLQTAKQEMALRVSETLQVAEIQAKGTGMIIDANDKRVQAAKDAAKIEEDLAKIRLEYEGKIIDLRKQQEEHDRQFAGQLFDSVLNHSTGDFFKAQARDQAKQIFENLTHDTLSKGFNGIGGAIGGQRDANGNLTSTGRLLQGTVFAPRVGAEELQAKDLQSRQENTGALVNLTEVLKMAAAGSTPIKVNVAQAGGVPLTSSSVSGGGVLSTNVAAIGGSNISTTNGGGGGSGLSSGIATALGLGAIAGPAIADLASPPGFPGKAVITTSAGITSSDAYPFRTPSALPRRTQYGRILGDIGMIGAAGAGAYGKIFGGGRVTGAEPGGYDAGGVLDSAIANVGGSQSDGKDINDPTNPYSLNSPDSSSSDSSGGSSSGSGTTNIASYATQGAAVLAGGFTAYQAFKRGGAKGNLAGVGAVLGTAAILDPEPISKAALAIGAAVSGIVSSLITDPKVLRAQKMNEMITGETYLAPPTVHAETDLRGNNIAYNKMGQAFSTKFQGFSIQEPALIKDPTTGGYIESPGQVIQPFQPGGGGAYIAPTPPSAGFRGPGGNAGPNITINVHALDTQSVLNRSADIGAAVYLELQKGGALGSQIQKAVLTN